MPVATFVEVPSSIAGELLKERGPTMIEETCKICMASMEYNMLKESDPVCSQCGLTAEQAKALDMERPVNANRGDANGFGFIEEADDKDGAIKMIEWPAIHASNAPVRQPEPKRVDAGMPFKKNAQARQKNMARIVKEKVSD